MHLFKGGKLWGGRFTGKTDPIMEKFNESLSYDKRMSRADITGSQAYARCIKSAGLITEAEADSIVEGLGQVCVVFSKNENFFLFVVLYYVGAPLFIASVIYENEKDLLRFKV